MSRLQEQVSELHGLYEQLTDLVFQQESATGDESTHQKISHSAFPGASRYWTWVTSVRSGTRHAEGDLEAGLSFAHVYRSDSDRNTHASLNRLVLLVEAWSGTCPRTAPPSTDSDEQTPPHVRHGLICAGAGWTPHVVEAVVDRWWTTGRELLELEEAWQRVPDPPAPSDPSEKPKVNLCPVCGNRSLRWRPKERRMRCVFPDCRQEWDSTDLEYLASTTYIGEAS